MTNFGEALEALKKGKKISRKGWNGSDMYVYLMPRSVRYPIDKSEPTVNGLVCFRETLMLKTAQNDHATWSPSGSDALAEDWVIL